MNFLTMILKYFLCFLNFMKMKVTDIGGSVYVRLPLDWIREHQIHEIGIIRMRETDDGSLVISPEVKR